MIIGGLQKFSLLDYPEHLSAVIFTKGCNFRCQFCYNPMLVWPDGEKTPYKEGKLNNKAILPESEKKEKGYPLVLEESLFVFLKNRVNRLEAVVVTGGEPTIHKDLPAFIFKIKSFGYKIKLDTNGTNPAMLKKLLAKNLVDYIAMDIKAPLAKYYLVCGRETNLNKIKESIKIIMTDKLPYEFRTTVVPGLITVDDIAVIGKLIKGAKKWYLQFFKSDTKLVNPALEKRAAYSDEEMIKMKKIAEQYVSVCGIR